VSTSLPTITQDLRASESDRTWIVVSYLITQTVRLGMIGRRGGLKRPQALQPVYARLPDVVGRKSLCHAAIAIFAVGSVLCGAAKVLRCRSRPLLVAHAETEPRRTADG
jgi:MFS family permease